MVQPEQRIRESVVERVTESEPTPEEIKEQQLYLELGLVADEYQLIIDHLGGLPNWTELGIYSVMWSEHCSYKNSKPLLRRFPVEGARVLQGPGKGQVLWISEMAKRWSSKLRATTIRRRWSPFKVRPPVSGELSGMCFPWEPGQWLCSILFVSESDPTPGFAIFLNNPWRGSPTMEM